jgi:hypothetical protein
MPRVVTILTRLHDPLAVAAACRQLGLPFPVYRQVCLAGQAMHGYLIELAGGRAPVALDTLTGLLRCHCEEGEHFPDRHLSRFLRAYAAEKARRLARQATPGPGLADVASELMEPEVY